MEKNKNIPVIYFKFGLMALQSGMNMRRTTFSWGSGVHIWEIYLAEKKSEKNVFADDLRYSEGMYRKLTLELCRYGESANERQEWGHVTRITHYIPIFPVPSF